MWPLTPTVELNVLAMKLGENAVYHVYEPPRPQPQSYPFGAIGATGATNAYDFRGMHYQRYHIPRGPYCATLTVGSRQFVGKGRTAQAARHAAAEEALKVLRELPLPLSNSENNAENNETNDGIDANTNSSDDYIKSPISLVHEMALKRNLSVKFEVIGETGPSHLPKFVTQCTVGEIVTTGEGNGKKVSKKNAAIKMLDELKKLEPLPTVHKCDDNKEISDQNVGNSVANTQRHRNPRLRKPFVKKKKSNSNIIKDTALKPSEDNNKETNDSSVNNNNSNLINTNSNNNNNNNNLNPNLSNCNISNKCEELVLESSSNGTTSSSLTIHPINRLIQLQQARKEKEPIFNVISERCTDRRRREFSIECTISITKGPNAPQVISAIGLGPNKKVAKKNAAESMLQQLGYSSKPQPQSILKQDSGEGQQLQKKIRQVKFVEDNSAQQLIDLSLIQPKMGRQLVPGLILMPTETNVGLKNGTNSRIDTNSMGDSTGL
jgi:dsRNA-specific ribonuclease